MFFQRYLTVGSELTPECSLVGKFVESVIIHVRRSRVSHAMIVHSSRRGDTVISSCEGRSPYRACS